MAFLKTQAAFAIFSCDFLILTFLNVLHMQWERYVLPGNLSIQLMQDWAFLQSGCFFRHTSDRFYVISYESLVGLLYDKCLDTSLIFCNNTFLRNQENTDVCNFLDGFLLQTKLICLEKSLFFLLLLCICHFVCLYSATCNYLCSQTACHRK